MIPSSTRMVTLRGRPERGADPTPDLFAIEERPIPALQPDQLLVRNVAMSVDPSMRGRLDLGEKHYTTNFEIGEPLDGSAIGVVIASESSDVAGRHVRSPSRRLARARRGRRRHRRPPSTSRRRRSVPGSACSARPASPPGSGSSGSANCARATRCSSPPPRARSAPPPAGSPSCSAHREWSAVPAVAAKVAAARRPSSATTTPWTTAPKRPATACRGSRPTASTSTSTTSAARSSSPRSRTCSIGGRVALCGMISQYSDDGRGQDINHLIEAVLRRITIRGFIVRDHEDMRPEFEQHRRRLAAIRRGRGAADRHRRHRPCRRRLPRDAARAATSARRSSASTRPGDLTDVSGRVWRRHAGDAVADRGRPRRRTRRRRGRGSAASWFEHRRQRGLDQRHQRRPRSHPPRRRSAGPAPAGTATRSSSTISSRVSRRSASTIRLRPIELTKYTVACGGGGAVQASTCVTSIAQPVGVAAWPAAYARISSSSCVAEPLHALDQDLLLRGEVVVHRGRGHVDGAGDVLHRDLVDRHRREQPHRAVDRRRGGATVGARVGGAGGGVDARTC